MAFDLADEVGRDAGWNYEFGTGIDKWFDFQAFISDAPLPDSFDIGSSYLCPRSANALAGAEEFLASVFTHASPFHIDSCLEAQNVNKRPRSASDGERNDPLQDYQPLPKKLKSGRYSHEHVQTLQTWFKNHQQDPYPAKNDKIHLSSATGLTTRQVEAWFTKARRKPFVSQANIFNESKSQASLFEQRKHRKILVGPSPTLQSSLAVTFSTPRARSLDKTSENDSWGCESGSEFKKIEEDRQPLSQCEGVLIEWWLRCLPDEGQAYVWEGMEPNESSNNGLSQNLISANSSLSSFQYRGYMTRMTAPPSLVQSHSSHQVAADDLNQLKDVLEELERRNPEDIEFPSTEAHRDNLSVYAGSNGKISAQSSQSAISSCSYTSFGSRRGRRLPYGAYNAFSDQVSVVAGNDQNSRDDTEQRTKPNVTESQCTFCRKPFDSKYKWRRHEESVHMPPSMWVCRRFRDNSNIGSAIHEQCWSKPITERTFYRKDALLQHLKGKLHNLGDVLNQIDLSSLELSSEIHPQNLGCGFCGQNNATWNDRVEHVAQHFSKDKMHMSQWMTAGEMGKLNHQKHVNQCVTRSIEVGDSSVINETKCSEAFDNVQNKPNEAIQTYSQLPAEYETLYGHSVKLSHSANRLREGFEQVEPVEALNMCLQPSDHDQHGTIYEHSILGSQLAKRVARPCARQEHLDATVWTQSLASQGYQTRLRTSPYLNSCHGQQTLHLVSHARQARKGGRHACAGLKWL